MLSTPQRTTEWHYHHCCRLTGVDWRQKIENQRGAVLATELKNNANKLAKWTAAALVAGVDLIKLGYVARAHPRDPHHHVILSTQVRRSLCCICHHPLSCRKL